VPARAPAAALVVAAATGVYALLAAIDPLARIAFAVAALALGSVLVALEAMSLGRESGSRSARMVSWTYWMLAATLLLRLLSLLSGVGPAAPLAPSLDVTLVIVSGLLAALWGNMGYLGFALERSQRQESEHQAELAAEKARTEQAERQAAELKQLSDERQELLRVIAHEVRQPLHNAQAVLQSVEDAVRAEAVVDEGPRVRVARARSVLRQITGGLDNILAASTLLVDARPTPLRDTDVDVLLELCLGDLPPAGRGRIRVVRDADVRTAALDLGLMRLALRNLLNNALAYSVPGSTVTLRVADSDDPLAVVFEVGDSGPGIAPDLLGRIFERGVRGRHDLPGQGLGLYIVRMAMRLQGGTVDVRSGPEGTVFTLSVPQGMEPA
jgi:signal transduction histidine kinase